MATKYASNAGRFLDLPQLREFFEKSLLYSGQLTRKSVKSQLNYSSEKTFTVTRTDPFSKDYGTDGPTPFFRPDCRPLLHKPSVRFFAGWNPNRIDRRPEDPAFTFLFLGGGFSENGRDRVAVFVSIDCFSAVPEELVRRPIAFR